VASVYASETTRKKIQMDNFTNADTQNVSATASTGCCGGKAKAQPASTSEPRAAEIVEDKPVKSGCCCGKN